MFTHFKTETKSETRNGLNMMSVLYLVGLDIPIVVTGSLQGRYRAVTGPLFGSSVTFGGMAFLYLKFIIAKGYKELMLTRRMKDGH